MSTPWTAYHLHWDDQCQWPDPWQMLQDNVFCGLARALGISYTVGMLDRADLTDAVLAECDGDNLVLIQQAKYVLNWDRDSIVNITPGRSVARRQIPLCALLDRIN